MRALSNRQASRCETAKTKTCKCRCGGALHGALRHKEAGDWAEPEAYFFEGLPADDPHHTRTPEEKRRMRKLARDRKKPQMLLFAEE